MDRSDVVDPKYILETRKRFGMSQQAFADATGINHQTNVGAYERGEKRMMWGTFFNCLQRLGVQVEIYIKFDTNPLVIIQRPTEDE